MLLVSILKQGNSTDAATTAAVCWAAKKLAANEDICKEMADDGAVKVTMKVGCLFGTLITVLLVDVRVAFKTDMEC